jgi:hypothetical protein
MAKASSKRGGTPAEEIKPGDLFLPEGFQLPAGYEEKTSDLVGIWNFKGSPVAHVIIRGATLHDSDVEPKKSSILLHCEAVETIETIDRNKEEGEAAPGDLVGIWCTPGMKEALKWQGAKQIIAHVGKLQTGKPNPMEAFKVFGSKNAKMEAVTILDDFRDTSKESPHMLQKLVIPGQSSTRLPKEVSDNGEDPNFEE